MKTLAFFTLALVGISTTLISSPFDQVAYYEQELACIEATMFQMEQQIACNVEHDYYNNYPNKRAQELIARLGLREFNSSINPFTHVGRYMDQSPSKSKQKKLRKELREIIQEQELKPYRNRHKETMQQLRQAVVQVALARLQQKNGYELTNQDLKRLKLLKRLVDPSYRNNLSCKISQYNTQISSLRSEINSLRNARETALALRHSSCMFCMTCHKKSHTCHVCHTCVDHCSCMYQTAKSVLATIADISAQESIANLTKHLHTLEATCNKLKNKLEQLNNTEQAIWDNYLKGKLNYYQTASNSCTNVGYQITNSSTTEPALTNYHIRLLQNELGYAQPDQGTDTNAAAFVGLGCAALATAGIVAICYGANS